MKTSSFQRGQGMTEYIIIVALIAVAAIAATRYFGGVVRSQTAAIAQEVAGNSGQVSNTAANDFGIKAEGEAGKDKNLKTFVGNN